MTRTSAKLIKHGTNTLHRPYMQSHINAEMVLQLVACTNILIWTLPLKKRKTVLLVVWLTDVCIVIYQHFLVTHICYFHSKPLFKL